MATLLGYTQRSSQFAQNIYIPKYYDPSIEADLGRLSQRYDLVSLGELIDAGEIEVLTGNDPGKMAYGGPIPFVRTTDLSGWEIVTEPRQGVSTEIYESYAAKQDVRPGDVLFVRDGLYLIGHAAMVADVDLPLIHTAHMIRFRAIGERVTGPMLLALLSTGIVRRQAKAKQFTAGIIDKIEDRYRQLVLPIPKSAKGRRSLHDPSLAIFERRIALRETLRRIPHVLLGAIDNLAEPVPRTAPRALSSAIHGFTQPFSRTSGSILIPKYYDPSIRDELDELRDTFVLPTIGDLVEEGSLAVSTGIEVGKMAYGGEAVPFIRTSDLVDWELKAETKQRVSRDVYKAAKKRVDVREGDILLVRDGTYLVGASAIVTAKDLPMLYAGGLYKLRCEAQDLDPYLLLAALHTSVVKAQVAAKRFTRDIIDTLGKRLFEIVVPIPRDASKRADIARTTRETVLERVALREAEKKKAAVT